MSEIERYIANVLRNIVAPPAERERIEADLWAHFQEGLNAGQSASDLINKMGDPKEVAAAFMAQTKLRYASFWRRLGAFLIDSVIQAVIMAAIALPAIALATLVPQNPLGADYIVGGIILIVLFAFALLELGVIILYFPIQEGRFGQTIAKRWLGIRVIKEDGLAIGYKEAFLRRISFYFEFIVIDALFIPFTDMHQRAFDIIARTIVVRDVA